LPYCTTKQRNRLGTAAARNQESGEAWSTELVAVCKDIANEMLRGNRKALGLRAGRPRREVLMSSDYLDEAHMKLRKRTA
jgi:hypothetical protein